VGDGGCGRTVRSPPPAGPDPDRARDGRARAHRSRRRGHQGAAAPVPPRPVLHPGTRPRRRGRSRTCPGGAGRLLAGAGPGSERRSGPRPGRAQHRERAMTRAEDRRERRAALSRRWAPVAAAIVTPLFALLIGADLPHALLLGGVLVVA